MANHRLDNALLDLHVLELWGRNSILGPAPSNRRDGVLMEERTRRIVRAIKILKTCRFPDA